jgi:hypothetical protein
MASNARLDVSEAKDAFKLFETINNRGLKLSPTDIIKNFVLGNAARFGVGPLNDARGEWARLITNLDGTDTDAFFRYFLSSRLQQRVTQSKVVVEFKKMFMGEVKEATQLDVFLVSANAFEESQPHKAANSVSVSFVRSRHTCRRSIRSSVIFSTVRNCLSSTPCTRRCMRNP